MERSLAPGEWAVLAVVSERPTHGFAVAKALAPSGEIGRVWSLPRPLVYRALNHLVVAGLVEKGEAEPSARGPNRLSVKATTIGRRRVRKWLNEPVDHVRDVRSLLMLKLLFLDRSGLDPGRLVAAQRDLLVPAAQALEEREQSLSGFERTLARWRLESTHAVIRFLDATRQAAVESAASGDRRR